MEKYTSAVVSSYLSDYIYVLRAGGASPVAQAMVGPIFETFQDFLSGHMLVQAENMRACHLQAKCQRCQTNVA